MEKAQISKILSNLATLGTLEREHAHEIEKIEKKRKFEIEKIREKAREVFRAAARTVMAQIAEKENKKHEKELGKFWPKFKETRRLRQVFVAKDENISKLPKHLGEEDQRCAGCGNHIPKGPVYVITIDGEVRNVVRYRDVEDEDYLGNPVGVYYMYKPGEVAVDLSSDDLLTLFSRLINNEYSQYSPSEPEMSLTQVV